MSFSRTAWEQNAAAYEAIRTMPFNEALAAGTLPPETFRHYIVQDAHYLVGFGRALTLAAAKAPSPERLIQFAEAGKEVLVEERALHTGYFAQWGIDEAAFADTPVTPATHHYVSYLLAVGFGERYEVVVAALLPCFWIYLEIGKDLDARAAADNPYRAWIDTYAGAAFEATVRDAIAAADEVAATASPKVVEAMLRAFATSTQLEWMFWHSAYHRHGWPLSPRADGA